MLHRTHLTVVLALLSPYAACFGYNPALNMARRAIHPSQQTLENRARTQTSNEQMRSRFEEKEQELKYTCRDIVRLCAADAQDIPHENSIEAQRFAAYFALFWNNGAGEDCIHNADYWIGSINFQKEQPGVVASYYATVALDQLEQIIIKKRAELTAEQSDQSQPASNQ